MATRSKTLPGRTLTTFRGPSIARLIAGASIFTLLCVAVAAAVILQGVTEIKVHGPVYSRIKTASDLTADILPPPLYVIEAYLTLYQLRSATEASEIRDLAGKL